MGSTSPKDKSRSFFCPFSAGMEFQVALDEAESRLEIQDFDVALELLKSLEEKYVEGARVFSLIGDVLLRTGDLEAGVKYKTFYEVLRGTFRTALQERQSGQEHTVHEPDTAPPEDPHSTPETASKESLDLPTAMFLKDEEEGGSEVFDLEVESEPSDAVHAEIAEPEEKAVEAESVSTKPAEQLFPATAAMGHEFLRQGHFQRALELFETLVQRDPADGSLREARDLALKKSKEKQLLEKLHGWLANVEVMKSGRFPE
jgi:tetratricopeptide (TPR) repeat protein